MNDLAESVPIDWLLEGDPAIRWQVMRDLLDAPASEVEAERRRVSEMGWGRRLLDCQSDDGRWAADQGPKEFEGLYSPKWTSTTYTLLLLRRLGLDPGHDGAHAGCRAIVERADWTDAGDVRLWGSDTADVAVCGIVSSILEWFDYDALGRRDGLVEYLLATQEADGSWTGDSNALAFTINVLEALQIRNQRRPSDAVDAALRNAHDYLLERHLFRSVDTGDPIRPAFTRFSFPPRWHYDVLRALDHLQAADASTDSRAVDAIDLVQKKQGADGMWPLQNRHRGKVHFEMEAPGEPSRGNTLRALRVLRWWADSASS